MRKIKSTIIWTVLFIDSTLDWTWGIGSWGNECEKPTLDEKSMAPCLGIQLGSLCLDFIFRWRFGSTGTRQSRASNTLNFIRRLLYHIGSMAAIQWSKIAIYQTIDSDILTINLCLFALRPLQSTFQTHEIDIAFINGEILTSIYVQIDYFRVPCNVIN